MSMSAEGGWVYELSRESTHDFVFTNRLGDGRGDPLDGSHPRRDLLNTPRRRSTRG